ncbi:MAG: tail fiber domain-containing protein [Polyangiaceae bacterium]
MNGADGSANINGTADHVVRFTGATTGGDGALLDDGATVGIGALDPAALLHLESANANALLSMSTTGANRPGIQFTNGFGAFYFGMVDNGGQDTRIAITAPDTNGLDYLSVLKNGRVGVNHKAPSFTLEVNGSAGKPGGGSWSAPSDVRLKTDVADFEDGLGVVDAIHPVSFRYTPESGLPTEERYIGVLAQELKKVAPYMVKENYQVGDNTYLSVDPSAMTYLLINAVKEQQRIIDDQSDRLDALEDRLARLENR